MKSEKYSKLDIDYIACNFSHKTLREIALSLNRTEASIRTFCYRLRKKGVVGVKSEKKPFSQVDIEFIKTNINSMSWPQMAEKLGRSRSVVEMKAQSLNLKKSKTDYLKNRDIWQNPTIMQAKVNLCLTSSLKPYDIPDSLAELHALRIKLKRQIKQLS